MTLTCMIETNVKRNTYSWLRSDKDILSSGHFTRLPPDGGFGIEVSLLAMVLWIIYSEITSTDTCPHTSTTQEQVPRSLLNRVASDPRGANQRIPSTLAPYLPERPYQYLLASIDETRQYTHLGQVKPMINWSQTISTWWLTAKEAPKSSFRYCSQIIHNRRINIIRVFT